MLEEVGAPALLDLVSIRFRMRRIGRCLKERKVWVELSVLAVRMVLMILFLLMDCHKVKGKWGRRTARERLESTEDKRGCHY